MMWDGFGGMSWGWIGTGVVHMLLFWVLVILGIAALTRWLAGDSAMDQRAASTSSRRAMPRARSPRSGSSR